MDKTKKVLEGSDTKVLKKVKLMNGGFGGVKIDYTERDERRDGMPEFENVYPGVSFTAPVTTEMISGFQRLNGFLLDICGYPLEGRDRTLLDLNVEVNGITYDPAKGFVLSGILKILDDKQINLVTPLLQNEEDYPGYGDIVGEIVRVFYDTKEYLSGRNRLSTLAMIEMVDKKKPIEGFVKEEFAKMGYAEQMQLAIKWLEDSGGHAILPPEVEAELEEAKEARAKELLASMPKDEEEDMSPDPSRFKPRLEVVENGDDFSVAHASVEELVVEELPAEMDEEVAFEEVKEEEEDFPV